MAAPPAPIIIVRKKGGHGAHHGGAWKVAYADFVTAMMALFIVLWLMHTSPEVQKAVGGYFKDPAGTGKRTGTAVGGSGEGITVSKLDMKDLKEKLEQAIEKKPEFKKLKENIEITITSEGLRVELIETEKGIFFESGESAPTPLGQDLLRQLAGELSKLKNPILIEGHTDSKAYGSLSYTNWELSADRANAARRYMQQAGLGAEQIKQIRGFADQQLRNPANPQDPANRRVTIIVHYPGDLRNLGEEHDLVKEAEIHPKPGQARETNSKSANGDDKSSAKPVEKENLLAKERH
jgi:chemotaxis protein MotB